jgi:CRP/FNR family cyclic AMP-dependent transcriptional regulator
MMVRISGRRRPAAPAALSSMKLSRAAHAFDPKVFLAKVGGGKTIANYARGQAIFTQGDPADSAFYIQTGKVKITVLSKQGKEAVLAMLGVGDFFGEGCLNGHPLRMTTATAMTECSIMRLQKVAMVRVLHDEPEFSELFIAFLLSRNSRIEEDLVDQLFNSSEKRLARVLLLLANFGKDSRREPVIPDVSQETLAEMVGTTRARVNHFMNNFRRLGFIEYNGKIQVHSSLMDVIIRD